MPRNSSVHCLGRMYGSYCTFLYSSLCTHTQNTHAHPHLPFAVCPSCFHCSPQWDVPKHRGCRRNCRDRSVVTAAQRHLGLNLHDSVPQLSRLQSSRLGKGTARLQFTLKGQTTQSSLRSRTSALGARNRASQQPLGWQIFIPTRRSLVTRKKRHTVFI